MPIATKTKSILIVMGYTLNAYLKTNANKSYPSNLTELFHDLPLQPKNCQPFNYHVSKDKTRCMVWGEIENSPYNGEKSYYFWNSVTDIPLITNEKDIKLFKSIDLEEKRIWQTIGS